MATLLLMVMSLTAQAQCYILGNDNQWDPSTPSATLPMTSTEGVYEGDVMFTNPYFCVGTKLGANSSDWATFNANRYGPSVQNALLTFNEPMDAYLGRDASFMVPATGTTYRVRVDLNNKQVTLIGTYPDKLYVIGSDNAWDMVNPAATLLPVEGEDGVFQGTVSVASSSHEFVISSKIGDWDIIDEGRYTSPSFPLKVNHDNTLRKYVSGDNNLAVPYNGTFQITVDLTDMTIEAYDPNYVPEYPYTIYIHGTDGKPVANEGVELEWNDVEGVYTGWVNFTSDQFNISTDLASTADGWEEISSKRIGASTALRNVETELSVPLVKGEPSNFTINASPENNLYACVTVDLRKGRMTIFGNDETYPVGLPKEMYVLGSDGNWFPRIPSGYVEATSEPGVYEGDITFTGEKDDLSFGHFAVLQRLGMNWDWINAKRLSPYSDEDWANLGEQTAIYTGIENPGAWQFTGDPGTYKIKVDISGTGYVLISENTASGISAAPTVSANGKTWYYDLSGRYLGSQEPQKGLFVAKGKKGVVKVKK